MSADKADIMKSMFGVFGKKAEDVKIKNDEQSGGTFFNPSPKDTKDGVWRGVIKFLPDLHGDLEKMTVNKVTYKVPEGQSSFKFDSPKSLGKYESCPVADAYWKLKGSNDAREKKLATKIKYSAPTYALVQIVVDQQKPENAGKILVWDLPKAIETKINALMYPAKADIDLGATPNNVFDPIDGQVMVLKIGIKKADGSEYRDYDGCAFTDKLPSTMIIDGEEKPAVITEENAQAKQEAMINTILAGPNLQDFAYKEPSVETLKRVNAALAALQGMEVDDEETSTEQTESSSQNSVEQPKAENSENVQAETKQEAPKAEMVSSEPANADEELLNSILGPNEQ